VRLTPEDEADGPQPALTRDEALRRLAELLDMHWNRGTRPVGTRPDLAFWTNDDITRALGWTSIKENTVRQRIRRLRNAEKPVRPGEGWFKGILISFFGKDDKALDDQARAERDELIAVYLAAKQGKATAKNERKPAAMTPTKTVRQTATEPQLLDWQFHCALRHGEFVFYVGSTPDRTDLRPFADGEGVIFHRRHVYVCRHRPSSGEWKTWYLTRCRPAHMAMRALGKYLYVFMNHKLKPDSFQMTGTRFSLELEALVAREVINVFEDRNWGWSPYINHQGDVHHGDSETNGNPQRLGQVIVEGKKWGDLGPIINGWLEATCRARRTRRRLPASPRNATGIAASSAVADSAHRWIV
jgi:hypothetical protein